MRKTKVGRDGHKVEGGASSLNMPPNKERDLGSRERALNGLRAEGLRLLLALPLTGTAILSKSADPRGNIR